MSTRLTVGDTAPDFTLPAADPRLEYRDCHPRTGFVPVPDEERS